MGKKGLDLERLPRVLHDQTLPGVIFSMRYPDNAGYVWNTIAQGKDEAASHIVTVAECFIAYPKLSRDATYVPRHLTPVELDCYDMSSAGKKALEVFVRRHRVKVIVFMSALPNTIDLAFLRKLGVRTVNTENDSFDHSKRDAFAKKLIKFFVRRVLKRQMHDMHLANATSQKAFLSSYALIPHSRLGLLIDGIDCDRFKPGDKIAACRQLGLAHDSFRIICVAQARAEKRLDYIIRAAKQVINARPNEKISFVYVGDSDGPLTSELKSLVAKLDLGEFFHFAGRQNDLVPYYRAADIMVHAAERESFGLAVVEGMACGLPVIASAAAGPAETILPGQTGALIGIDDFDGFVNQILYYVDNKQIIIEHGRAARTHVTSLYSLDRYGRELAKYVEPYL
ncbi:MAG: glycosyltransferase family 4 protein [Noviherbaspirillum sp.]